MSTMKRTLNPSTLELILRIYYSPVAPSDMTTEAKLQSIQKLFSYELIELKDKEYKCTSRGYAYVDLILSTKLPSSAWVDKDNNILRTE